VSGARCEWNEHLDANGAKRRERSERGYPSGKNVVQKGLLAWLAEQE
jgi:hypothetical protein